MKADVFQAIENNPLFFGLNDELIREIATSTSRKTLGTNETLFRKGDRAHAIWGVLSGRIVTQVWAEDGKELLLDAFEAGDIFGKVGVLDFGPRSVDAIAQLNTELFCISRRQFLKYLQLSPELCFRVFSLLCNDLRTTTEALEDTALYALPGRLAKRLISFANIKKQESTNGFPVVSISHNDLARLLGVHRVTVSRQLSLWEKSGILSSGRQRIEILDLQALTEVSAPGQAREITNQDWTSISTSQDSLQNEGLSSPIKYSAGQDYRGVLAVDAAEYSRSLVSDAAGTLKRLKDGMNAIDKAILDGGGRLISHSGDRVLAEFQEASKAYKAALTIHESVDGFGVRGSNHSIFRIGVHFGRVTTTENAFFGEAANAAIRLTEFSSAGGICISGQAREKLNIPDIPELQYLGKHELKNVADPVSIYAARPISMVRKLILRAESLIPRRLRFASAIGGALVTAAVIWTVGEQIGSRTAAGNAILPPSIAVLPFDYVGDPDHSYLSNGLASEIRSALGILPDILVIAGSSVDYFNGRDSSPSEIGDALQTGWLLQGSVGRTGDELTASARLIESANGTQAWNREFNGKWAELGNFTTAIINLTRDSLLGGAGNGSSNLDLSAITDNEEAHSLFLRAEHIFAQGMCFGFDRAVPLLQRAVELDPGFAQAWARLAYHYGGNCPLLREYPKSRKKLAEEALSRAMMLAPESPMVLAAAAAKKVKEGNLQGARLIVNKALSLNANNTDALYQLAMIYFEQNNDLAGSEVIKRLLHLDPLNFRYLSYYSYGLTINRRWQELIDLGQKTLDYYPDNIVPYYWIAKAHLNLGSRVTAIEMQRLAMPFGAPIDLWTGLDYQWGANIRHQIRFAGPRAYAGHFNEARQLIKDEYTNKDDVSSPGNSVGYLINMGEIEALDGNFELSVNYFEQAIETLPGKENELESADYGPWLSGTRQSYATLALLHAYRKLGESTKAENIANIFLQNLERSRQQNTSTGVSTELMSLYAKIQFYAIEGDISEALRLLRYWRENDNAIFTYVKSDPFLENLYDEPEFQLIVAEIEAELAEVRAAYLAKKMAFKN